MIAPLCLITSRVTECDFNILSSIEIFLLLTIKAKKEPLKASPAAVVSIALSCWTVIVFISSNLFLYNI